MSFRYLNASEGDYTDRVDTEVNHSEGFVVYNTETRAEHGVFATAEEAQAACDELNGE